MDRDFEIEIQEEDRETPEGIRLPVNFLTFGELETDDVKVYIRQEVYQALETFAASDTGRELGSILLGEYAQEMGKTYVVISDYIEARYTDASASTLTFTHETWEDIHAQREKHFPEKKILGWQHTHPNYGIFLSNYDLFIQENFFDLPFQVAYVIDPIQKLRGFFQWKKGKVEKLRGYYIYDDPGKPIKLELAPSGAEKPAPVGAPVWMKGMLVLLCMAVLFLSGWMLRLNGQMKTRLAEQEAQIAQLTAALTQTREEQKDAAEQTTVEDLAKMVESHEAALQDQEALLAEIQARMEGADGEEEGLTHYTVAPGDTLAKICASHGLDFKKNIQKIIRLNGIEKADEIYVGQTLLLPTGE